MKKLSIVSGLLAAGLIAVSGVNTANASNELESLSDSAIAESKEYTVARTGVNSSHAAVLEAERLEAERIAAEQAAAEAARAQAASRGNNYGYSQGYGGQSYGGYSGAADGLLLPSGMTGLPAPPGATTSCYDLLTPESVERCLNTNWGL